MKGSLGLGKYAGIPLKVHWTFGLILIYVLYESVKAGFNWFDFILSLMVIITLFGCVVLHEYGHALAARRYNVSTKDIILTPIGGLARLSHIPEIPIHELIIALAGPFVNLVIVFLIMAVYLPLFGWPGIQPFVSILLDGSPSLLNYFLAVFAIMNAIMLLFNMLPAFPMDGGRVLRALLAMKLPRLKATQIASYLGQALSIGFVIWGIYNNQITLGFIGIFIFLAARSEYRAVRYTENFKNTRIGELLSPNHLSQIQGNQSIQQMIDKPIKDYLVVDENDKAIGILYQAQISKAFQLKLFDHLVGHMMVPLIESLESNVSLSKAIEVFKKGNYTVLPVTSGDKAIGLLSRQDIQNYLSKLST